MPPNGSGLRSFSFKEVIKVANKQKTLLNYKASDIIAELDHMDGQSLSSKKVGSTLKVEDKALRTENLRDNKVIQKREAIVPKEKQLLPCLNEKVNCSFKQAFMDEHGVSTSGVRSALSYTSMPLGYAPYSAYQPGYGPASYYDPSFSAFHNSLIILNELSEESETEHNKKRKSVKKFFKESPVKSFLAAC